MTLESPTALERLLRGNDLGWFIDSYRTEDRAVLLEDLVKLLDAVAAEYRSRTGADVSFTPEALMAEAAKNPHKVRAFLQALVTTATPEMLVMVWCILQGRSIRQVEMKYREQLEFDLKVVLTGSKGGTDAYHSSNIVDVLLLHHFGISIINGKPLFADFFSLKTQ